MTLCSPHSDDAVETDDAALLDLIWEHADGDGFLYSASHISLESILKASDWSEQRCRSAIARLLRGRRLVSPVRGYYYVRTLPGDAGHRLLPMTLRQVGETWLKARGLPWTSTVTRSRHRVGLAPGQPGHDELGVPEGYESLRPGGCGFEATPAWVFDLPEDLPRLIAQAVRTLLYEQVELDELARPLGLRLLPDAENDLREAVEIFESRGLERCAAFARSALACLLGDEKGPSPSAPPNWSPPPEDGPTTAMVDEWRVVRNRQGVPMLAARHVIHPELLGGPLSHSSPLIYIDEVVGWAMTCDRYYRLGRKAVHR